ncbi:MAG: GNAT family N-acetyltransferase [Gammaproteobacteria bacterium]
MNDVPLDNPVWSALRTHHSRFALTHGAVARYPADMAPFVAVGSAQPGPEEPLERSVGAGDSVYFVGVVPELGAAWQVSFLGLMPQMICQSPVVVRPGPELLVLTEARHRADMMALTGLVFPGFFRSRTPEMGRYLGIYVDDKLVAMAGERMRFDRYREISAVCTHPGFLGRGYAQRLIAQLTNDNLEQGITPMLHVNRDNVRAISVYERLGYTHRAQIMLCSAKRL